MNALQVDVIAKGILAWIAFIVGFLTVMAVITHGQSTNAFFQIGPNDRLQLFGQPINTLGRYFTVVVYTMISTVVRTLQQEVITPWIIQNVQNDDVKDAYTMQYGMMIVIVNVVYTWTDWFMYINILLAQADLLFIEMAGNVAMSMYTTDVYLRSTTISNQRLPQTYRSS